MTYPTPKPGTGLNTIAFDLDGTLAEPTWPSPEIGQPIASAVDALKHYAGKGFEIIIYTSRPKSHAFRIKSWLVRNEIDAFVYDIITDKPRAAMYVDDRAVSFPEAFVEASRVKPRRMYYPSPGSVAHDETDTCGKYECVPEETQGPAGPSVGHVAAECSVCRRNVTVGTGFSKWGGPLE